MQDGRFPWSNLMIQHPWFDFLKNQCTKHVDPSLGVNQMWTKRNDHAPKANVLIFFFFKCPKRANLKKKLKFDHSLIFFSSPQNISLILFLFHITSLLCHGPLPFSSRTSLVSPTTKPIGPCQRIT